MSGLINYISEKEIKNQTLESIQVVIDELSTAMLDSLKIRDMLKSGESLENL